MSKPKKQLTKSQKGVNKETNQRLVAQQFSGPIPPPAILEHYNAIIPNGAERIFIMAEKEQEHRQTIEKSIVKSDNQEAKRGMIFAFIVVILLLLGSFYLTINDYKISGLATILTTIVSISALFIYGRKKIK